MRKTLLLLAAGLLLAACYHAPVKPPVGYLYSDFSAPQGVYGDGSVEKVGLYEKRCGIQPGSRSPTWTSRLRWAVNGG